MFLLIKLNVGGYLAKNNDVTENTPITQDNTEDMETRTLELGGLAGTLVPLITRTWVDYIFCLV